MQLSPPQPVFDTQPMQVTAPGKLNLSLEVLGRRPDGYHNLVSLMLGISLYDTLWFSPRSDREITLQLVDRRPRITSSNSPPTGSSPTTSSGGGMPTSDQNLVVRAAKALRDLVDPTGSASLGVDIRLLKRIPLQAGLAGGSSDAASTLIGLNRLWRCGVDRTGLQQLGATLGSDIPFFFTPGLAAVIRGRGEQTAAVPLTGRFWFVVVKPDSGLSTPAVFAEWSKQNSQRPSNGDAGRDSAIALLTALQRGDFRGVSQSFRNDLQSPAAALNDDIARLQMAFSKLPVVAHQMSGSGTSYFGLCRSRAHAVHVAGRLTGRKLGHVFVVHGLNSCSSADDYPRAEGVLSQSDLSQPVS